ncbi:MAG: mechanosensitive ion channel family protein [Haloarculaceae archaeon]
MERSTVLQVVPRSPTAAWEQVEPALVTLATFLAAVIVVLGLGRVVVRPLATRAMTRGGLDETLRSVLANVLNVVLAAVALGTGLVVAGFGGVLTGLLTTGGAVAIIVAFVAREPLAAIAAGFFILGEKPFGIGDWIEWEDNRGIVEDVGLRVTRVRTFENERVTVPNSELAENAITNPVAYETRRISVGFSIDYDEDIAAARRIVREVAESNPGVADDPAPDVVVRELADSGIRMEARVWLRDPDRSGFVNVRSQLTARIKHRFDAESVTIPFPQRTVSERA